MRKHRLLPLCALLGVLFAGLLPKLDAQGQEDCAQGLAADIYFLVDSSWSMGQENFEHVRQFLYSVVKALHEGGGGRFQFALIQYSGSPKTEFQLNTYPSPLGALAHIRAMAYRGGGTRTGLGLDFLVRLDGAWFAHHHPSPNVLPLQPSDQSPQVISCLRSVQRLMEHLNAWGGERGSEGTKERVKGEQLDSEC